MPTQILAEHKAMIQWIIAVFDICEYNRYQVRMADREELRYLRALGASPRYAASTILQLRNGDGVIE